MNNAVVDDDVVVGVHLEDHSIAIHVVVDVDVVVVVVVDDDDNSSERDARRQQLY